MPLSDADMETCSSLIGGVVNKVTLYLLENSLMESEEVLWFDDSTSVEEVV